MQVGLVSESTEDIPQPDCTLHDTHEVLPESPLFMQHRAGTTKYTLKIEIFYFG